MTSIGPSPGIGPGPQFTVNSVQPVGATAPTSHAPASTSAAASVTGTLGTGGATVDEDRVTMIRKAIQSGNYPVIPTKIGDAMIAAGVLLRTT